MDVAAGVAFVAVLVAVLWLLGEMWVAADLAERRRERRMRAYRRLQVRKADRWRFDLEEQAALVAMRRVADDIDREAKL